MRRSTTSCPSSIAARRAIALDSSLADGYSELAWASLNRFDLSTAEAAARRAAGVEPNNSEAHNFAAVVDFWLGRMDEAIAESRRAVSLNPRSVDALAEYGDLLSWAGREDEALVVLEPLRSLRPKVRRVSGTVGGIYEARRMWRDAIVEAGNDSGKIARILAESGQVDEARAILRGLEARWNGGRGRAWDVAGVYFGLHEYDSAFTWLDRSVDDFSLRPDIFGPVFADARADPRFRELMRRLGLPARRERPVSGSK